MTYRCLADIPHEQARLRGDKVAVQCEGRSLTYAELERRSERAAALLVAEGVSAGDRVAWLGRTHERFYEILFAAAKVRACLSPINIRLALPEVVFILQDSRTRLFLVSEEYLSVAKAAVALIEHPIRIVSLEDYPRLCESAPPRPAVKLQPDDDVVQVYTSGTTGRPKGVRLTNSNYASYLTARSQIDGMNYQADDVVLAAMPLFHVAGINISLTTLAAGGRLIVMPAFEVQAALHLIETEKVTRTTLAPAMLTMCLQSPGIETVNLSSLQSVIYGASPIGQAMLAEATRRFGCAFVQVYGLTETTGAATYLPPSAHTPESLRVSPELLRSCGLPWPSLQMAVLDDAGNHLGPDVIGEIAIKGPLVMPGYWNRPDATAEALTAEGWLRTGDAGYRNSAGFYFICDRVKDMIVSGGENVYPAEVENAIMGCPGVADVAVIGVPDPRWGEAVKAIVVPAPGTTPDPARIIAWARTQIAGYKVPKSVEFIATLPRNPSGKVLRRELRAPYWADRDRQIG